MAEREETGESGSDVSTRRDLLRMFARNARERAQDAAPMIREARQAIDAIALGASDHTAPAVVGAGEALTPARRPVRCLSMEDLIGLAHGERLIERDPELGSLAQRSLRMTSIEPARAGAWLLTSDAWAIRGDPETVVAQLDLAAAAAHESGLPGQGWLILFVGSVEPSGESTAARAARGVVLDFPAEVGDGLEPMGMGAELVMPRLWHEAVQRLELEDNEADAYVRVRARMHELQGVEDDADGGPGIAYHRVLGYPNETTGTMPTDCARAASEQEYQPGQWRLLLQISLAHRRRLYVWIRDGDLQQGTFEQLCAFVQ